MYCNYKVFVVLWFEVCVKYCENFERKKNYYMVVWEYGSGEVLKYYVIRK